MNFFKVVLSLFTVAAAAPNRPDVAVEARRRLREHVEIYDDFGQFALRYVTAEGTVVSERGRLVPTPDGASYVMIVEGEISYIGDDGQTYVTEYTADVDGAHVDVAFEGHHLQVPDTNATPTPEPVAEPVENAPRTSYPAFEARRRLPALEHEEIHDEFGQFALRYMTAECTVCRSAAGSCPLRTAPVTKWSSRERSHISVTMAGHTLPSTPLACEGNNLTVPVTTEPLNEPFVIAEPVEVIAEPFELFTKQ